MAFSLLLILDVNRSVPIYMSIVIASFGFYMQGVMLYGIHTGSLQTAWELIILKNGSTLKAI